MHTREDEKRSFMEEDMAPLQIDAQARKDLEWYVRECPYPQKNRRAAMVLALANGAAVEAVAAQYGLKPETVLKWKRCFAEDGLGGLDAYFSGVRPTEGVPFDEAVKLAKKAQRAAEKARRAERPVQSACGYGALKPIEDPEDTSYLEDVIILLDVRDEHGNVVRQHKVVLPKILADTDHFDVCTLEGFQRDFGRFERGVAAGISQITQMFLIDSIKRQCEEEGREISPEQERELERFVRESVEEKMRQRRNRGGQ